MAQIMNAPRFAKLPAGALPIEIIRGVRGARPAAIACVIAILLDGLAV
jgi:hypothetical protein